jgi:hypothetical protein
MTGVSGLYQNTKSAKIRRPFYSDYVRHALRFYTRNLQITRFKTEADHDNWYSCHNVLKDYSDRDRNIIVSVYSGYDTLADNVYETSKEFGINQNVIWDIMKDFERKVAQERKLI